MRILELDSGDLEFNNIKLINHTTSSLSSLGVGYMPEDQAHP